MVAQLLRLRLRLLANSLRRPVGQLVGRGIAIFLSVLLVAWSTRALSEAIGEDASAARGMFVVIASIVTSAFFVFPLLFTSEDPLDPRRFALFGLPERSLALSIAVAGLVAVPVALVLAAALTSVVGWSAHSAAWFGTAFVGIVAVVVGVAFCALLARIASATAALLLEGQRARSLGGALGILAIVVAAPVIVLLAAQDWKNDGQAVLNELANFASWTPVGAPWAAVTDAGSEQWLTAVLRMLLAVAYLGIAWLLWRLLVGGMLVAPGRPESQRAARGLGWFDRTTHGPTGAIAARSFTYWTRDPRYWVSVAIIPIAPALIMLPLLIAGVPGMGLALLPVPFMCLFIGWAPHNDVAYDGSAVWLHVASGSRGAPDRIGRLIPVLVTGIIVIGLGSALSVALYGNWDVLPSMLGVSTALLLCGLGCASFTSARFPYAVSRPGDGAFTQPQSSTGNSPAVQALSILSILLLASPTIVFAGLAFIDGPEWHLAALVSGVGIGVVVLIVGVWWGSYTLERRGPEILAAALRS